MMKSLALGSVVFVVTALASYMFGDRSMTIKIPGVVGLVSLFLAGVFSGGLAGGSQIRANYATETRGDREQRQNWSLSLFLFSLPNLAGAVLVYYFL